MHSTVSHAAHLLRLHALRGHACQDGAARTGGPAGTLLRSGHKLRRAATATCGAKAAAAATPAGSPARPLRSKAPASCAKVATAAASTLAAHGLPLLHLLLQGRRVAGASRTLSAAFSCQAIEVVDGAGLQCYPCTAHNSA